MGPQRHWRKYLTPGLWGLVLVLFGLAIVWALLD
jgi:hypothetical protein